MAITTLETVTSTAWTEAAVAGDSGLVQTRTTGVDLYAAVSAAEPGTADNGGAIVFIATKEGNQGGTKNFLFDLALGENLYLRTAASEAQVVLS